MSAGESREFDWLQDAGDVVVRSQPAIAIYPGPAGVIIRRQGDICDDGDDVIWFAAEQAPAIAAAIMEAAGLDAKAMAPEPTRKPKDTTAAGRQRRYRERQKKESTPEPDIFGRDVTRDVTPEDRDATPRDGVPA